MKFTSKWAIIIVVLAVFVQCGPDEPEYPEWPFYSLSEMGVTGPSVLAIIKGENQNMYMVSGKEIIEYKDNTWHTIHVFSSDKFASIGKQVGEKLFIGTNQGLCIVDVNTYAVEFQTTQNSEIPGDLINDLAVQINDNDTVLWVATATGGLGKLNQGVWTTYNTSNSSLTSNEITAVATNSNGILWVSVFGPPNFTSAYIRINTLDDSWEVHDKTSIGFYIFYCQAVAVNSAGDFWAIGGELVYFHNNTWSFTNNQNSPIPLINMACMLVGADNTVYIGTADYGLSVQADNEWKSYNAMNSGLNSNLIGCFELGHNNDLWIGTTGGIVIFNTLNG